MAGLGWVSGRNPDLSLTGAFALEGCARGGRLAGLRNFTLAFDASAPMSHPGYWGMCLVFGLRLLLPPPFWAAFLPLNQLLRDRPQLLHSIGID